MKSKNRALLKERPTRVEQLRTSDITNKKHPCNPANGGHDYRFLPFDNYGMCTKCKGEILT